MNALSGLLCIYMTYLAYQWGVGHKKRPNAFIVFCVIALSFITTVPAYYIGRHNKKKEEANG